MVLTEDQIQAACDWWAEQLKAPEQRMLSDSEREAPSQMALQMSEMLLGMSKGVDESLLPAFKDRLAERLRAIDGRYHFPGLHVDYGPNGILADAAEVAGISTHMGTFPVKTNMWFGDDGSVTIRLGYGQPEQVVLAGSSPTMR